MKPYCSSALRKERMELEEFLIRDNKAMRSAGCKLAEAAIRVIREYDGLHRLSLAVAEWSRVIACEGGRVAPKENSV